MIKKNPSRFVEKDYIGYKKPVSSENINDKDDDEKIFHFRFLLTSSVQIYMLKFKNETIIDLKC